MNKYMNKPLNKKTTRFALRTLVGLAGLLLLVLGLGFRSQNSILASWAHLRAQGQAQGSPAIWEPAIEKFELADKANPPKPGMIVFAGSSSFARWSTLVDDMKPLDVLNRGFGGSQMSDLDFYAKRIVNVYRPEAVVVYEGDNDLALTSPKTPQMVADGFRQFVQTVRGDLPDTWIYFISIKPSKLRWNEWPKMKAANAMIQAYAGTQRRVQYIDVASAMFDAQGNLPGDLFVSDGLHPTPKCYALWTSIIKPILLTRFGGSAENSRGVGVSPWANPRAGYALAFATLPTIPGMPN
jgi:lysophospholipase L1-like esterase